jgi:rhamnosyltransferase
LVYGTSSFMKKIAGVVILFHPNFSKLITNISSYINQIEKLWIVCNSLVKEEEKTKITNLHPNIFFLINQENLGIAKALNQAANLAFNLGYNWLLTMDQDSRFISDKYFQFFREIDSDQVAIFAPNPGKLYGQDDIEDQTIKNVQYVITSGNLLNLNIWKKLGGFDEKLFIDEVDHDYCLRAALDKFQIIQFKNVPFIHELGKEKEITFLFKKIKLTSHSPARTYYILRNNLYMFQKYRNDFPDFVKERKQTLLKTLLKTILFDENKQAHLKSVYKAIKDYRNDCYGKITGY